MVNLVQDFSPLLVTHKDVEDIHPKWNKTAVEDYLAKYRDVISLSETTGEIIDQVATIEERVTLLEERVTSLEFKCIVDVELQAGETEHTTTRFERVVCNNTDPAIVNLNPTPVDGEEVIVWTKGDQVRILGPINGENELVVWNRYDTPHLKYSALSGEWGIG